MSKKQLIRVDYTRLEERVIVMVLAGRYGIRPRGVQTGRIPSKPTMDLKFSSRLKDDPKQEEIKKETT